MLVFELLNAGATGLPIDGQTCTQAAPVYCDLNSQIDTTELLQGSAFGGGNQVIQAQQDP